MKPIWSGVAAAIGCMVTVVVAAQTTTTPPQQPQTQSPQSAGSDHRITVVGCLQPAPPNPTGTTGSEPTSDATGGEKKFVLTDVAATPNAAPNETAATAAPPAKTYRLIANEAALSPHVGKKVELTGTVDEQDSSARSSSPTSSESASASATNAPRLKVESGKVMAATCTQ